MSGASLDSGKVLFPYKCDKCGYTVTYDSPQPEYADGFICGSCLGFALAGKDEYEPSN